MIDDGMVKIAVMSLGGETSEAMGSPSIVLFFFTHSLCFPTDFTAKYMIPCHAR